MLVKYVFSFPARFINLKRTLEVDVDLQARLKHLKNDVLPSGLPAENLWSSSVPWAPSGLDPGLIKHHLYLRSFGHAVESHLKRLIDLETLVLNRFASSGDSDFCEEVLIHLHRCRAMVETFVGREALLGSVLDRLGRKLKDEEEWKEEKEEEKEKEEKGERTQLLLGDDSSANEDVSKT